MVRNSLLFILLFFLYSCSNIKSNSFIDIFGQVREIVVDKIAFEVDSLRNPSMMEYLDGKLYFCDYNQSTFITVFDWKTGEYIGDFAKRGLGPNEFIHLNTLNSVGHKLSFWDINKRKMTLVTFGEEDWTNFNYSEIEILPNPMVSANFKVYPLTEELFLTTGIVKNHRMALLGSSGQVLNTFGDYPKKNAEEIGTDAENAFAYQGSIAYHPGKRILVIGSFHGESISFYDLDNMSSPKLMKEYVYSYPQYKDISSANSQSVAFLPDNIVGFIDVKFLSEYCVCLFSGKTMKEEAYKGGKQLLLFDIEGNPVKAVMLDQQFTSIAVNEDEQEIILLGHDSDSSDFLISKINLLNILNN